MGMESTHTEVSGGGSTGSVADLPSDWRRQMDEEMRDALKMLGQENNIQDDEFTANDAVGIWRPSLGGTKAYLARLVKEGSVTVRKAYNPETKCRTNAYKKV